MYTARNKPLSKLNQISPRTVSKPVIGPKTPNRMIDSRQKRMFN